MSREHLSSLTADITENYRHGALAYRQANPGAANPYQPGTSASERWQRGFDNEQRYVHVVAGTDVISSGLEGPITLPVSPNLHRQPRKTYLAYVHALMIATGMYGRAVPLVKKNPFITGLQLRNALNEQGDVLSADFATLIRERIKLDARKRGATLTDDEARSVDQSTEATKALLLTIAHMQDG